MKQLLLFACMLLTSVGLTAQVIYVDGGATGTNDGTSWANAYLELDSAFVNAVEGDAIWIADGTYTTPADGPFEITSGISVLGGFDGTETSADAADPAANVTILSGDVLGNDVVGVYDSAGYEDNNRVLNIVDDAEMSSFTVTLDGFTVANGGINDNGSTEASFGAGIYSSARLTTSRLSFVGNRGTRGSVMRLFGVNTVGSTFDDWNVGVNFVTSNWLITMEQTGGITWSNCLFTGAGMTADAGPAMLRTDGVFNLAVNNCTFSDINSERVGSAFVIVGSDDISMTDCTFNNIMTPAGTVFVSGRADGDMEDLDATDHIFTNLTFVNCIASGTSGAFDFRNSNATINNISVTETGTFAGSSGVFYQGNNDTGQSYELDINGGSFSNMTGRRFGGSIGASCFGISALDFTINDVSFDEVNSAATGFGSAIWFQTSSEIGSIAVNNCTFNESVAENGVIGMNGSVDASFRNSSFTDNGNPTISQNGGVILLFGNDNTVGVLIDSCEFVGNSIGADPDFVSGGGVLYSGGADFNPLPYTITNSSFRNNSSGDGSSGGGAAYFIGGFDLTIDNCEFIGNSSAGQGGAITVDVRTGDALRDTTDGVINIAFQPFTGSISNTLFLSNISGSQGGAISTQRAVFDLTNCVFADNSVATAGNGGGAIIFNGNSPSFDLTTGLDSAGSLELEANLVHNTFYNNLKGESDVAVGDQIALFQPNVAASETNFLEVNTMTINLLNNAFILPEAVDMALPQIDAEPSPLTDPRIRRIGDLFINSLGGNFINAEENPFVRFGANDFRTEILDEFEDFEDIFTDLDNIDDDIFDFGLALGDDDGASNPLIDAGVQSSLVPATDIFGTDRDDNPDIGAVEAVLPPNSTVEPIENSGLKMTFFPNPTADVITIQNDEAQITRFQVMVSDQTGRVIRARNFNGVSNNLNLTNVPTGVYTLQLLIDGKVYSKQIVKQ